jgi:hypothetical protein
MLYVIIRGYCDNLLNVLAPTEDKSDDMKDSIYKRPKCVFDQVLKSYIKILLDFSAKVGREDIFKPAVENEILHESSNDNEVRVVNFATSKNVIVKSTMFPHHNIHKYICTSTDGKMHSQIDHVLVDKRWHLSIVDI